MKLKLTKKHIQTLIDRVEQLESENAVLNSENDSLTEHNDELLTIRTRLMQEQEDAQALLQAYKDENATLHSNLLDLQDLEDEVDKLKDDLGIAQKANLDALAKNVTLRVELKEAAQDFLLCEKENDALRDKLKKADKLMVEASILAIENTPQ